MSKPRNTNNPLTLADFQPSQPEPHVPKRHLEGDTWVCEGCGSPVRFEGDWCGPCCLAWVAQHNAWITLNNSEFDAWYALHRDGIAEPGLAENGIHNGEFVPDRILEDRKRYFKDTIQPFRDGEPSREFIDAYPVQAKKTFTEKEMKTAKYVYREIAPSRYKGGTK